MIKEKRLTGAGVGPLGHGLLPRSRSHGVRLNMQRADRCACTRSDGGASRRGIDGSRTYVLVWGQMAKQKKAAVSFSIPTEIRKFQRRIEHGGSSPERRLRTMERLKTAGIFVSAAVSPLMPYGAEFAASLIECASRLHSGVTALGIRLGHPAARFDRSTPISARLQAIGR
jgi:hypothetical protein